MLNLPTSTNISFPNSLTTVLPLVNDFATDPKGLISTPILTSPKKIVSTFLSNAIFLPL